MRRSDAPRRPQPGKSHCRVVTPDCTAAKGGTLGRCATPRRKNSSPSKGDTSPLLLKNKMSEAAFGLLNRGLAIVTKPDLASSRQILRSRPSPVQLEDAGRNVACRGAGRRRANSNAGAELLSAEPSHVYISGDLLPL